jgi:excisionase family DNA binding protein
VDRLNKVPEVAEKLGISEKTVWAWIGARRIAVHRVGRSVRVPESEIRRILDDGYTPPKSASERRQVPRASASHKGSPRVSAGWTETLKITTTV